MNLHLELAALAAAFLWGCSALAWGLAGRRVGSVPVTAIRILLASIILGAASWIFTGSPWPVGMNGESVAILAASGILGAGVGDLCMFRAMVLLGPRLVMLILSLSPILASVIAYVAMNEVLPPWAIAGIALTVGGVIWVVGDPLGRTAWGTHGQHFKQGIIFAVIGAIFVAVGFVLSRLGMQEGPRLFTQGAPRVKIDAFPATLVRVYAATVLCVLALPLLGRFRDTVRTFANRKAMVILLLGTIVGPVVGIWLSMVAMKGLDVGIATALISTSPIMMIPIAFFAYGERPSLRTLIGTVLAVAGVFILMIKP